MNCAEHDARDGVDAIGIAESGNHAHPLQSLRTAAATFPLGRLQAVADPGRLIRRHHKSVAKILAKARHTH